MSATKSPTAKKTAAGKTTGSASAKRGVNAAKLKAAPATYQEKRRLLTVRLNKLRAEAEQLSINASRLLERITS